MSRDKQIEEIAEIILDVDRSYYGMECDEIQAKAEATAIYAKGYRKSQEVAREIFEEIDDLRRYIILNENIALKCKQENGEKNEDYWKGKLSAFKQIRAYIDAERKKKYTESWKDDG